MRRRNRDNTIRYSPEIKELAQQILDDPVSKTLNWLAAKKGDDHMKPLHPEILMAAPEARAELWECKHEAVSLCQKFSVPVRFEHNGNIYEVTPQNIADAVTKKPKPGEVTRVTR